MANVTISTILNLETLFINDIFGSATLFFIVAFAFIFWYSLKHNMSPVVALFLSITFVGLFSAWYLEIWWLMIAIIAVLMTMAWKRFLGRD